MTTEVRRALAILGVLVAVAVLPAFALAEEPKTEAAPAETGTAPATPEATPVKPEREKHPVLMYIPNRLFDILDMARLRVRVGPGFTVQARATEFVDVALGAHATVFAGIPGPRGRPRVNLPVGLETFAGAEVSVVGETTEEGWSKPYYGTLEVGAGFQAAIIGLDVGIDPLEILDFAGGIFFIDLKGDDY
jgi:hypothetical protein